MAGHSQFKNIMHRKGAQDAKRAKEFTKLRREIAVAAKHGGPDIKFNPALRLAVDKARAKNMPRDNIDKAILSSTEAKDDSFEDMRYEGFAPGGVAIIVEALTDNRNRTAGDVRSAFTKSGGALGETGSVSYMFDKVGYIEYNVSIATADEMLEAAIDAGADDCALEDDIHVIYTKPESLNEVRENLVVKFKEPSEAKITWKPQNYIVVNDIEQAEKIMKLVEVLEDNDDVQQVTGNYEFSEDVMAKLMK